MHHAKLNGLPVLDEAGKVVGYLDQLELLMAWVHATGREPLLEPRATATDDADDAPDGLASWRVWRSSSPPTP